MKCPIDGSDLVMTERQGIEIDYCPKCRGIWLDRGELDKIIERSGMVAAPQPPVAAQPPAAQPPPAAPQQPVYQQPPVYQQQPPGYQQQPPPPRRDYDDDDHYKREGYSEYDRKKKQKSFLGELFDF